MQGRVPLYRHYIHLWLQVVVVQMLLIGIWAPIRSLNKQKVRLIWTKYTVSLNKSTKVDGTKTKTTPKFGVVFNLPKNKFLSLIF